MDDLASIDTKPVLSHYIAIMSTVLKQQYNSHALLDEEKVGTHGIVYELNKSDMRMPAHNERCNAGIFRIFVF